MWHNVCDTCWYTANPDQYLPATTHESECDSCGDPYACTVKVQGQQELKRIIEAVDLKAKRASIVAQYGENPPHLVRGQADGPWPYGTTHDYNCPACVYSGSSYLTSPRSETYWAS